METLSYVGVTSSLASRGHEQCGRNAWRGGLACWRRDCTGAFSAKKGERWRTR